MMQLRLALDAQVQTVLELQKAQGGLRDLAGYAHAAPIQWTGKTDVGPSLRDLLRDHYATRANPKGQVFDAIHHRLNFGEQVHFDFPQDAQV